MATKNVGSAAVRNLVEKFRGAGYWGLCDSYNRHTTDAPAVKTTIHYAGVEKSVSDRGDGAPEWLRSLDKGIDSLADTSGWIGNPFSGGLPSPNRPAPVPPEIVLMLRPDTVLLFIRDAPTRTA